MMIKAVKAGRATFGTGTQSTRGRDLFGLEEGPSLVGRSTNEYQRGGLLEGLLVSHPLGSYLPGLSARPSPPVADQREGSLGTRPDPS